MKNNYLSLEPITKITDKYWRWIHMGFLSLAGLPVTAVPSATELSNEQVSGVYH